ncbi:MAG: ribosome silencing factor [Ruminococcaceae bacterium]|nr:ribosome silencing factor [Oscillospiraceae bacterium]
MTSLELAREIAKILDSKKATDIKVLNIGELSSLGDYFVLASGSNTTQTKALCDEIDEQLGKLGLNPRRIEGYQSASWILLDYVDVIVHIFYSETREFYSLERLWADVKQVEL